MKKALLVLSLILLISFLTPQTFAWYHTDTNEEDWVNFNYWGPRIDNILGVIHTGQVADYNSWKAELIDFFDWHVTPEQKAELDTEDPDMTTWERLFFAEWGMFEVDINNQVFPGTDYNFRLALSRLINKDAFISTQLDGMGQAAHSPLWHNPVYQYQPCAEFISEDYNPSEAYQLLYDNGYQDWDTDGVVEYSPDGGTTVDEFTIVLYGRADDPARTALAELLNDVLTTSASESIIGAAFDIDLNIVAKSICYAKVMIDYNYTLYTGGWSFGRDPDTIYFLFHSDFATKPTPWAANYVNYRSTGFDTATEEMIAAATFNDALYWANESQRIFMSDLPAIPVWNTAGYTGFLSTVNNVVHMGIAPYYSGMTKWWSMLNAYTTDPFGGTLRWGFMNDFEATSVYNSQWVWDWLILEEIYDSLIVYDPYNYTADIPSMAQSWEIGTWDYEGDACTSVTYKLRHDLYWQDIPPKADRLYGIAPQGTGALHVDSQGDPDPQPPIPVTAQDVAFTVEYIGEDWAAWNWGLVSDVVYCDVIDPYTITVYYGLYLPLWANHWCGGLPIMPKFIWGEVPVGVAGEYDTLSEKTLAGCGPFTWNYDGYVENQYLVLDKYERYHHLNPVDVYVDASAVRLDPGLTVSYTVQVTCWDALATSTGDLTIKEDGVTVHTETDISIGPKVTYETGSFNTGALARGSHSITAIFDINSPTEYALMDSTYTHKIFVTIREDLNTDYYVNVKDAVILGVAFAAKPGDINWDSRADIYKDGFINVKDAVKLGVVFGWPTV